MSFEKFLFYPTGNGDQYYTTRFELRDAFPNYANSDYLLYNNHYWVGRYVSDIPHPQVDKYSLGLNTRFFPGALNSGFIFPRIPTVGSWNDEYCQSQLGVTEKDLIEWCDITQVRLKNEFTDLLKSYNLNLNTTQLLDESYLSYDYSGIENPKIIDFYARDISLNFKVRGPRRHLQVSYDFSYLNYLLWSYENSKGSQLTYPHEENYWILHRSTHDFNWVKVNRDYGPTEEESALNAIAEECSLRERLDSYQLAYATHPYHEETFLLPALKTSKSSTPRSSTVLLLRQHIFIWTKVFSIHINSAKSNKLPHIEFINTKLIVLEKFIIAESIECFTYIKWDHKHSKTEVGIYFLNKSLTRDINTEAFIYLLDTALSSETASSIASSYNKSNWKPLPIKLRRSSQKLEIYLDLNPGLIPQIFFVLNNFCNLSLITRKFECKQYDFEARLDLFT